MAADRETPHFDEVEELLRCGPSDVTDVAPPDSVWPRVEAEARRAGRSAGRRFAIVAALAAAVLLVAVPLGLAARSAQRTETAAPPATTAGPSAVDLEPLDGYADASGWAALTGRHLAVGTENLAPLGAGETYELWLLPSSGRDALGPLWVGTVGTSDSFAVDPGVDLDEYTTVDISIEPDDGDPAHSGRSVLRGALRPDA